MQYYVFKVDELKFGDFKAVKVGDQEVLLINVDGEIFVFYLKCIYYGVFFVDGILNGSWLVCFWYYVCFDVKIG